jgi:RNA polymerase sigma-70 factor, ECF subfamily
MALNIVKKFKDKQTINRLKNKDTQAFIEIYDRYQNDLYRFIYFKIGKQEESQDLTSMVFLKTWNHIQNKSLSDSKTLRALVYKIARNAIIDYYRQGQAKIESLDDEANPIHIIDEKQDIAHDLDEGLELQRLSQLIRQLKEEYKEIIVLKFINELELEEISAVTGKSKGSLRVTLHRALKALKELVIEEKAKNGN